MKITMLQTVEDSHVLSDPAEMAVAPVVGHVVRNQTDKRGRVLTQTRVGKLHNAVTYDLPKSQADEMIELGYARAEA